MRFTIQRPDLGKALAETEKDIERAVTSGMRDAADGLKQDLREDVIAAGLGERLYRTWRGKTFPELGESAEAAAYVWSRAPKISITLMTIAVIGQSRSTGRAVNAARPEFCVGRGGGRDRSHDPGSSSLGSLHKGFGIRLRVSRHRPRGAQYGRQPAGSSEKLFGSLRHL